MPRDGVAAKDIDAPGRAGAGLAVAVDRGGQVPCGSRGMALPLLGLMIRLKGAAAKSDECNYSAIFVEGRCVGPVLSGETCEAESLAALESFQVVIQRRGAGAEASGAGPREGRARGAPAGALPRQRRSDRDV